MAKRKGGWKREPARHSLAARGVGTTKNLLRGRMSGLQDYQGKYRKGIQKSWGDARADIEEALKLVAASRDEYLTQREMDALQALEEEAFDICTDYAHAGLYIADDRLVADVGRLWRKYIDDADDPVENARYLVDDSGRM